MSSSILLATGVLLLASATVSGQAAPSAGVGEALDLPQSGDHVVVAHDPALAPSEVTVEAWCRFGNTPDIFGTVIRKNVSGASTYVLGARKAAPGSGQAYVPEFSVTTAMSGTVTAVATSSLAEGMPHHLAGSYDGSRVRVYLDGVEVGSSPARGPLVDGGGPLQIGFGDPLPGAGEPFIGQVDAARVWDHARSPCQVAGGANRQLSSAGGLVAAWNMNGDLADATGNGHDGTPVGTARLVGGFVTFTRSLGPGTVVNVAHAGDLVPPTGLTVEAWVRRPAVAGLGESIVTKAFGYSLVTDPFFDSILWTVNTTITSSVQARSSFALPAGRATHLAATWDNAVARLYVDGVLAAQASGATGPVNALGFPLQIADTSASGETDGVRIWRYALDAGEIAALAERELTSAPGLVASWTFEGDLIDQTGNGHDGVAQGAVVFVDEIGAQVGTTFCAPRGFGAPSTGCPPGPWIVSAHLPEPGVRFRMGCVGASPNVPGLLMITLGSRTTPRFVKGVGLWLNQFPLFLTLPVGTDASGRHFLELRANLGFERTRLSFQFLWVDPACGAQGLVTSDAVEIGVPPGL